MMKADSTLLMSFISKSVSCIGLRKMCVLFLTNHNKKRNDQTAAFSKSTASVQFNLLQCSRMKNHFIVLFLMPLTHRSTSSCDHRVTICILS